MHYHKLFSIWVIIALGASFFSLHQAPAVRAATNGDFTALSDLDATPGTCANFFVSPQFTFTASTLDYSIYDEIAVVATDGNGLPIDIEEVYATVGTTSNSSFDLLNGRIRYMTARPITLRMYDIPDLPINMTDSVEAYEMIRTHPVIATEVFDPVDYITDGSCAELPYNNGDPNDPAPSTIINPAGDIYETMPRFYWDPVATAQTYRLYVQDAYGAVILDTVYAHANYCFEGTDCYADPAVTLTLGQNYSAWIQTQSANGAVWSVVANFRVVEEPPYETYLTEPTGTINQAQPAYVWGEAYFATSYRLMVSDQIGTTVVDEIYSDVGAICDGSGFCTGTPSVTLPDGDYVAWVQSRNSSGDIWSAGLTFTVITAEVPTAVTITAPVGGVTDTTPAYTWNTDPAATSYRLYVQNEAGAIAVDQIYDASICSAGVCTAEPNITLTVGAGYSTWVQARNSAGDAWSVATSFYVSGVTPVAATLTAPAGATLDTTPTYSWGEVSGATHYRLYVSNDLGAMQLDQTYTAASCTAGTCSADPGVTLPIGGYTAWVLTSNASGNGPWSAGLGFYISTGAPAAPTLIAPTGTGAATQPTYQWNEAATATQYRLYVQDVNGTVITNEVVTSSVCTAGTCSYTPTATLNVGTEYLWWVLAANAGGGAWSSSASFIPGSVPGTTTITAPVSPTSATQPTYEWAEVSGASNYRLYVATSGGTLVLDQVFPSSNCTAGVCAVTPAVTLTPAETYQAWVLASNAVGNGSWSAGYFFAVNP